MNPIKLIRKLGKLLRGGSTSRQIFLGVFLGFAAGMIPGLNLTLLVCVFLLLILNTNGGLAVPAYALGKILCILLAPLTFRLGYFMIHDVGLSGLVRALADTPVLALLDLQVYSLMGALPIIIIVGGALGWALAALIAKARASIVAATDRSGKMRKLADNKIARFFLWLAFGGQKARLADTLTKKSPIFLKGRIITALVLIAIIVVLQYLFLDRLAGRGIRAALSTVSGAEVNIENAELSLLNGRLVIEGLQVTDAARPEYNQVQADRIVSDISISDMLRKRFVIDQIECDTMQMDVPRRTPGAVYRKPEKKKEPVEIKIGKSGADIQEYYNQVKKLNERFGKLKEYLKSGDPGAKTKPSEADLEQMAKNRGYLRLSAKDYLTKHPVWVIRRATVRGLSVHEELPSMTVEAQDLSSHPSLHPEPMSIKASPDEQAVKDFQAKLAGGLKQKAGDALKEKIGDEDKGGLIKSIFK